MPTTHYIRDAYELDEAIRLAEVNNTKLVLRDQYEEAWEFSPEHHGLRPSEGWGYWVDGYPYEIVSAT